MRYYEIDESWSFKIHNILNNKKLVDSILKYWETFKDVNRIAQEMNLDNREIQKVLIQHNKIKGRK